MATQTYTGVIDHTSDAGFRAWAGALHDAIVAAGLVPTADTGQADFATVSRPATNNYVYRIYRFDDSQQATRPVFLRLEYGTGSNADRPALRFTLGSGANGAGVISGAHLTNVTCATQNSPSPDKSALLTTRVCAVDGAFWFAFGLGAVASGCYGFLHIGRSVSSDGSPDAEGLFVVARGLIPSTANNLQCIRYGVGDVLSMANGSSCLVAGGITSSLVGGSSAQVFKHYIPLPRIRPIPWLLTVMNAELGNNAQFEAIPVGVAPRNYISLGAEGFSSPGIACALPSHSGQTYAMIWE